MPLEPNINALWFGKQAAKGTENTTPAHRGIWVGGDLELNRDDGSEPYSDLSKYGDATDYINSLTGGGTLGIEATPSETGALLWLAHGQETVTAGTNNVWTVAGAPSSGTFTLNIWDGTQSVAITGIANTVSSAALATSINNALTAVGHTGTPVATSGGPLNSGSITVTFSGTTTARRPFVLSKTSDTTSPAVTLTESTPAVRTKHNFVPQITQGHWATFVKRVGSSEVMRQAFIDALIGGFTIEGNTGQKPVRISPQVLSLDPGKTVASDPAAELPEGPERRPFLYTDGVGAFEIDGLVARGQSQFQFSVNEDRSPVYADDVVAHDLAVGTPTATIGCTIVFDEAGHEEWNRLVYGEANPAAGTRPVRNLPALGSYATSLVHKDSRGLPTGHRLDVSIPGVKWAVPPAPAPNPSGGNTEVALAGQVRTVAGEDPYSIDVYNQDPSTYSA